MKEKRMIVGIILIVISISGCSIQANETQYIDENNYVHKKYDLDELFTTNTDEDDDAEIREKAYTNAMEQASSELKDELDEAYDYIMNDIDELFK